jgi:HPt (histidine-containing phosphotransfer) domain-containing protein
MVAQMSPLCHDTLNSLHEATGEVFQDILNIYISDARNNIDTLLQIAEQNEHEQLLRLVHTLKGSSRNVGARELGEICESFEKLLRSEEQCDISKHVEQINTAYETTVPLLQKYLDQ